jgi:acyl-CoA synthetase (NDP forming)
VPSYPAVESAVRALASVVGYAVWLRTPNGPAVALEGVDPAGAKAFVNRLLIEHPDGRDLEGEELRSLLAFYGIDLWASIPVTTAKQALDAGRQLGWDVVLKATTDRLRERPDLAHVSRNIDTAAQMRDAWHTLNEIITDPETAGFVVQRNAPPGIPVTVASIEDPLFGPVVSFGISGPLTELLEDRSFRIPPLGERDAEAMVREIKAAPILFGYRGSEAVDVAEVERLVSRVAQLQHDLPQVAMLDLALVLAGADSLTVLTAFGRVEPVSDPRSDWFVRRMPALADTIPG